MKKVVLGVFLIACIDSYANSWKFWESSRSRCDTNVAPQILALPLSAFIGLPVDSLLNALPSSYNRRGFIPIGIGYAKGVSQGYGTTDENNCFIDIYIDNFQHIIFPINARITTWNFTPARQEIISFIKVWSKNMCVYGCNNPNYY